MSGSVKNCVQCGISFEKPTKISSAQWRDRKYCSKRCASMKRDVTDAEICSLYLAGQSTPEIGGKLGLSQVHISRIVRQYGVTRNPSERIVLGHSKPEVREKLSLAKRGVACPEHVKERLRNITGPEHSSWGGGLTLMTSGYLAFTSSPANGTHAGKCVHTVIAEWKIGRPLKEKEVVHHIDGNKLNNNPENLTVMLNADHNRLHAIENRLGVKKCQVA